LVIERNNSFIALLGKGGCSRLRPPKLQACLEEGAPGFYREVQESSWFPQELCTCSQPPSSCFQGGSWFLKQKDKKGGQKVCGRE